MAQTAQLLLPRAHDHVHYEAEGGHVRKQVGAAVADEGQRDACYRQYAQNHADVLENVEHEHGGRADDDVFAEGVLGPQRMVDEPPEKHHEGDQQADRSDKAEGFSL